MQKIVPCLWFNGNAEEAVHFYTSVFKNSKIGRVSHYTEDVGPMPKGAVLTIAFQLEGLDYLALNGGPDFKFTEALSLMIGCQTQGEIDTLWKKLTDGGGEPGQCGWLKDKFGVSWQIVPAMLDEWVSDEDPARAERVMHALMPMTKLDLGALRQAANAATS